MQSRVKLGQKVQDVTSGVTGIVEAITEWLNGCIRITIQPPMKKDGTVPDRVTIDEPQLKILSATPVSLPGSPRVARTGGNQPGLPRGQQVRR